MTYHRAVDSSSLQVEQIERMLASLSRQRDYLWKLVERMRVRRFPADDPIYRAALGTYEKSSNLCVVLATHCEKLRERAVYNTIMTQKPWGGDGDKGGGGASG
jgi:hypothetical protein